MVVDGTVYSSNTNDWSRKQVLHLVEIFGIGQSQGTNAISAKVGAGVEETEFSLSVSTCLANQLEAINSVFVKKNIQASAI